MESRSGCTNPRSTKLWGAFSSCNRSNEFCSGFRLFSLPERFLGWVIGEPNSQCTQQGRASYKLGDSSDFFFFTLFGI